MMPGPNIKNNGVELRVSRLFIIHVKVSDLHFRGWE